MIQEFIVVINIKKKKKKKKTQRLFITIITNKLIVINFNFHLF